ncbi:MAG: RadC family protein [Bacillota bacterium]
MNESAKKADKNLNKIRVKNVHKGHRKRLKSRYHKEGLANFEDHQVLEMLLFFAIPHRDTNDLAHQLLNEYGSFSAVLEADPLDMIKIKGVGEHTALLLTILPEILGRYQKDKSGRNLYIQDTESLAKYAVSLMVGQQNEAFYLICLDAQNKVNNAAMLHVGTINEVTVYPRSVVETAIRHNAKSVALVHNHPSGNLTPSVNDMNLTYKLMDIMQEISISVVDHIIVSNDRYLSFAEKGLLIR